MALPVIVLAFVWVGRFIGWLFACVALPTHLLFLLVNVRMTTPDGRPI